MNAWVAGKLCGPLTARAISEQLCNGVVCFVQAVTVECIDLETSLVDT